MARAYSIEFGREHLPKEYKDWSFRIVVWYWYDFSVQLRTPWTGTWVQGESIKWFRKEILAFFVNFKSGKKVWVDRFKNI